MNILLAAERTLRFVTNDIIDLYGGYDVLANLFINLARIYPQHNFYVLSNMKDLGEHPDNFIDLYHEILAESKQITHPKYGTKLYHYQEFYNYIDKHSIKFDKAIVYFRGQGKVCEWDKGYISEKTNKEFSPRMCDISTSHYLCVIKHYNIPWIAIEDDPTQINHLPKDIHTPIEIWGQYNGIDNSKTYEGTSLSELRERNIPVIYNQIEKLWLRYKQKVDWRNFEKTNKFILATNPYVKRIKYLKEWYLDRVQDAKVYGNFVKETAAIKHDLEHLGIDKSVFDNTPISKMEDKMFNTRYSLVVPTNTKNFVTQKVWTLLYYGIVPFWCKNDYDVNNIYSDFPDYIKISSVDELYNKMDELDNNTEMYQNLKEQLWNMLDDKYFCDDIIHEIFDEELN